jgi:hypothetical protein
MANPWGSWPPPTDPTSSTVRNLSSVAGATVTDALNTLTGVVVALTSNSIANASGVAGATVTAALNTLSAAIAALTSTSIANVSGVAGATVTAALNALSAAIAALTSTSIANVSGVAGATVTAALNALSSTIAALTTTSIANASGVAGATATAALNALSSTIAALTSTSIANSSSVSGATVTAALNALLAGRAARDPIWDPPTTPSADDQECDTDFLAAGTGGWTLATFAAVGTPMTRDGDLDLTQSVTAGHYRSSCIGKTLFIQLRQNEGCLLWRQVAAALSTQQLWVAGLGFQWEVGTASTNDPQISIQCLKQTGSNPDFNNRAFVTTGTSADRYTVQAVNAGTPTAASSTNTFQFGQLDGLCLRINHGSAAAGNISGFGFTRSGVVNTVCNADGPQLNASTNKIAIGFQGNTASPVVPGVNNVLFAMKFLRRIPLGSNGWIAQN